MYKIVFIGTSGGLQKPITIMAKDPKTGAMRPVTLYPKNVVKNPGGITTIQLGPRPSNIKIAPSASPGVSTFSSSGVMPGVISGNMPVMIRPPGYIHSKNPSVVKVDDKDKHGLICKEGCNCPQMNVSIYIFLKVSYHTFFEEI